MKQTNFNKTIFVHEANKFTKQKKGVGVSAGRRLYLGKVTRVKLTNNHQIEFAKKQKRVQSAPFHRRTMPPAEPECPTTAYEEELGDFGRIRVLCDPGGHWGGSCGSSLWASGPALVRWLALAPQRAEIFLGRSVLELGGQH